MRQATLVRGRLAEHPLWSRALAAPGLGPRVIRPVIVSARVEDRERVPDAPFLERLSITELVRDARQAASDGIAGLLLFGHADRKDETAMLASERDHVVSRALHAVKDAAPDLAVATDVCVCAYTPHGQCVLFKEGAADVDGTLARLAEIALVHVDAGADLLLPSGTLDGSVRALRAALAASGHEKTPVAGMVKLASRMYAAHRRAVEAAPVTEPAVPLIAPEDSEGARARATRDVAAGADAIVVKPGLSTGDLVSRIAQVADRPVIAYMTADEHGLFHASDDVDGDALEHESLVAARRAGAELIVSYAATDTEG